jgi:hypothetical protein
VTALSTVLRIPDFVIPRYDTINASRLLQQLRKKTLLVLWVLHGYQAMSIVLPVFNLTKIRSCRTPYKRHAMRTFPKLFLRDYKCYFARLSSRFLHLEVIKPSAYMQLVASYISHK